MKIRTPLTLVPVIVSILSLVFAAAGQRPKVVTKKTAAPVKPIIFAVLNDGGTLEPIAYVNRGKLEQTAGGDDTPAIITAFNRTYYKPGTVYKLVFGAANGGTVTVKSSDAKAECSRDMAQATTKATKTPLKGLVMGLATSGTVKPAESAVRRKPTDAERTEVEALVKAEYVRQKLTPKTLRYHNLTALDLDSDGRAELVGSYWIEIDKLTRGLLFFIAGQSAGGKYSLGYKEYNFIDQAKVMSGDIKNVDEGVYHELLLDAFDYNGDGKSEVFTYVQSFEAAGFNVYRRTGDKWTKVFEGSNYHCGY